MSDELIATLGGLSKITRSNLEDRVTSNRQRRNQTCEDFDKEYTGVGQDDVPATIYLAMSPDLIYIDNWEFKLIVEPFILPVSGTDSGVSPAYLELDKIDISVSSTTASPTAPHTHTLSPNPHDHGIKPNPHSHSINAGVTLINPEFSEFTLEFDGVDITQHLMAQSENWVSGTGMYPDTSVDKRFNFLEAFNHVSPEQRTSFLSPGYHPVTMRANGVFRVKLREFKKYSFINR